MATEVAHVVASSLRASITSHDVHSVQNIQIPGPELKEKEDRVDSPTPIIKGLEKAFSLNAHPVPDDSLKEITNIERPAPLQCIGKQREKSEDPGDQNSSIMSPTVISPTTKAALISAGRTQLNW